MYLLDANVFIDAKRRYYPFAICPGFWDWLDKVQSDGQVASVEKVADELVDFGDELSAWARRRPDWFLEPDDRVAASLVEIATWTDTRDYTAAAQAEFLASADYYLIAQAHAHSHTVVTHERSQPDQRSRIKSTDACNAFGVECISRFTLLAREGAKFVLDPT